MDTRNLLVRSISTKNDNTINQHDSCRRVTTWIMVQNNRTCKSILFLGKAPQVKLIAIRPSIISPNDHLLIWRFSKYTHIYDSQYPFNIFTLTNLLLYLELLIPLTYKKRYPALQQTHHFANMVISAIFNAHWLF